MPGIYPDGGTAESLARRLDQHGANEDMLSFFRADLTETWDKIDICMFMVYMTLH